jgi:hypothetical protein
MLVFWNNSKTVCTCCTVYSCLEVITGNNGKILDAIGSQKLSASRYKQNIYYL